MSVPLPKNIVETLIENYGKWGALGIGFTAVLLFFLWQLYLDKRKNKYFNIVIQEKDKAIQRIAEECRYLRFWLLKRTTNLSDAEIRNLVEKNEYNTAEEARRGMEEERRDEQ